MTNALTTIVPVPLWMLLLVMGPDRADLLRRAAIRLRSTPP